MATITVMAKAYKDVAQWVRAAKMGKPDLAETRLAIANQTEGEIAVVLLASKEDTGPAFTSYFFTLRSSPILVEVVCRANDPKRAEYSNSAKWMIERATAAR